MPLFTLIEESVRSSIVSFGEVRVLLVWIEGVALDTCEADLLLLRLTGGPKDGAVDAKAR